MNRNDLKGLLHARIHHIRQNSGRMQTVSAANELPEVEEYEQLVEKCLAKSKPDKQKPHLSNPSEQSIDDLLMSIYSNNIRKKEAKAFLNYTLYDDRFAENVLQHLRIITYPVAPLAEDEKEMLPPTHAMMNIVRESYGKQSLLDSIRNFFEYFKILRFSLRFAVPAGLVVIAFFLWSHISQDKIYDHYFAAGTDFHIEKQIELRGSSDFSQGANSALLSHLSWGIIYFNDSQYSKALQKFRSIHENSAFLESDDPAFSLQLYLCEGLSYLALSERNANSPYLNQAIHFLRKAKEINAEYNLPEDHSIAFFLGMSYIIKENCSDATPLLQNIQSNSGYYQHAVHYLNQCNG